ncbi:MAG: hypothetical protein IT269_02730 [Saprospiraceae bacterium]|nr:hypothetical protein [Saprospiraceae bacterium]
MILFVMLTNVGFAFSQGRITLKNASFEENESSPGVTPNGWLNVGALQTSPPDIQPGQFEVSLAAQHGDRYVGLVTRDNNTWEGVGQVLNGSIKKGSSYGFSVWLSRSNVYMSLTPSGKMVNFNGPTILRIWGYNTRTKRDELLAESAPVGHSKWVKYNFVFKPTLDDYDEIDLMAYYAPGSELKPGNLLIDNCSDIEQTADESDTGRGMIETPSDEIQFANPSFERAGRYASTTGWFVWQDELEASPSIEPGHSIKEGEKSAAEGRFFAVLLTDEGKSHSISQNIFPALKKDTTYAVSISLSRMKKFKFLHSGVGYKYHFSSTTQVLTKRTYASKKREAFDDASQQLCIWGVNHQDSQAELLAQSPLIDHTEWKTYTFHLKPQSFDCQQIYFSIQNNQDKNSKGHLLIDDCSLIRKLTGI